MTEQPGEVAVLNVGYGDTKLSFDKSNPAECARARRIITDMLKRGYAVLVEAGKDTKTGEPLYRRAHGFDPETDEYLIMGGPEDDVSVGADGTNDRPRTAMSNPVSSEAPFGRKADWTPRKKPGRPARRLPAGKTRAVVVGRVAGG